MDFPIEFASDHEAAEARHGAVKKQCLDRIDPGNTSRWGHRDDSDEEFARVLATIAWESGWDEAVLAARTAHADRVQAATLAQLITQRDAEHEAARAWRERYEEQIQRTQDLDQRWQAKWREAQDALVKMKAERNEARADVVACMMAYRHRLPIDGGTLQRLETYVRGMNPEEPALDTVFGDDRALRGGEETHCRDCCCARIWEVLGNPPYEPNRGLVERVQELVKGQVTYWETSLVSDPPDPLCALDQRKEGAKDGNASE
jgi:hypothetical protein